MGWRYWGCLELRDFGEVNSNWVCVNYTQDKERSKGRELLTFFLYCCMITEDTRSGQKGSQPQSSWSTSGCLYSYMYIYIKIFIFSTSFCVIFLAQVRFLDARKHWNVDTWTWFGTLFLFALMMFLLTHHTPNSFFPSEFILGVFSFVCQLVLIHIWVY